MRLELAMFPMKVVKKLKGGGKAMILSAGVVTAAAVLGGIYGEPVEPNRPSPSSENQPVVRDYARAMRILENNYVVLPDRERLTRSSIQQMLHKLDPHSNFFNRRDFSEMQDEQSSRFYGIGVTVNRRNGRIYVIGVSRDKPADVAGLRYGDAIIAVDGTRTENWTQADALRHIRGEKGTNVEITVERAGMNELLTVRIRRDEVPFPSVRNAFMLRPGVGYIGLTGGFNQDTSRELGEAMADLRRQGMETLVLDLRKNPGGLLRQAVEVAEMFLPRGVEIVSVRGRRRAPQIYRSENARPEMVPLLVMINGETASASEIVAGAMQDLGRAWIVGEESFGKGLVQTIFRIRGGTGLTLTTAKYYTPSGRSIQRSYDDRGFYDYFNSGRLPEINQGGVRPDRIIKSGEENIALRDACFEFTRNLLAGRTLVKPGAAHPEQAYLKEDAIGALIRFLRTRPKSGVGEAEVRSKAEYVRRRIRAEIITAEEGIEAAERYLIETDPQTLAALGEIPKALGLKARLEMAPARE